ncbi:hypothetical protein ACHAXS_006895 [Conticribra weissflogii]
MSGSSTRAIPSKTPASPIPTVSSMGCLTGAAEMNQLPEFLRFNKYGGVLTPEERRQVAKSKGVCVTCGRTTHRVTPFRTLPLDNSRVRNGVCLFCRPDGWMDKEGVRVGGALAHAHNNYGHVVPSNAVVSAAGGQSNHNGISLDFSSGNGTNQVSFLGTSTERNTNSSSYSNRSNNNTPPKRQPQEQQKKSLAHNLIVGRKPQRPTVGLHSASEKSDFSIFNKNSNSNSKNNPNKSTNNNYRSNKLDSNCSHDSNNHQKNSNNYNLRDNHNPLVTTTPTNMNSDHKYAHLLGNPSYQDEETPRFHYDEVKYPQHYQPMKKNQQPKSLQKNKNSRNKSNSNNDAQPMDPKYDFSAPTNNDAWDIVKSMRSNPTSIPILTRKCHELRSIGTNQAGSLYEVIEVMRRHSRISSIQFAGIGALWSLFADGGDDRKSEAIDAGASKVILEAIKNVPGDADLVAWAMGALSSLAEGMGSRADLAEVGGVVEGIQRLLEIYVGGGGSNGCGDMVVVERVSYWVFRCLAMLVYEYNDVEDGDSCDEVKDYNVSSRVNDRRHSDASLIRDMDAMDRYTDAFFNTTVANSVLVALETIPMNAITMEWGLKFLAHLPLEECDQDERDSLMEVCTRAVDKGIPKMFPTLINLSCAIICNFAATSEPSAEGTNSWASRFFTISINRLISNVNEDSRARNLMICTLSHVLAFGNLTLGFSDSKKVIKLCIGIMEEKKECAFETETCCCILYCVFVNAPIAIRHTEVPSKALEILQKAMIQHYERIRLMAIALDALTEVSLLNDCDHTNTIDFVMTVISNLSPTIAKSEIMIEKTLAFLSKICKSKHHATCFEIRGGLALVNSSLKSKSKVVQKEAINVMYKIATLSDGCVFTLGTLKQLEDSVKSNFSGDRYMAAKSLYIIAASVDIRKQDFSQYATLGLEFTQIVIESFPTDASIQKLGCLSARKIATLAQKSNISLDVSSVLMPILDAQRLLGVQVQKDSLDTIWALMGIKWELRPKELRELTLCTVETVKMNSGISSSRRSFRGDVVTSGMAIFADIFAEPVQALKVLGMQKVERIIELVLSLIYACLDKFGNHPFIFSFGFSVLQRLCNINECQSLIVRYGGIVAVIDGMIANGGNATIQEKGCNILRRLATYHLEIKIIIVESDGVDAVLNNMMTHSANEAVMEEACGALSVLCVDKQTRTFIIQQGGVLLLENAMEIHIGNNIIQEKALDALCLLSSDADLDILLTSNIFKSIKDALDNHLQKSNVQRRGLSILRNFSLRNERVKSAIESSGCLDNCAKVLEMHSSSPKVIDSAFSIFLHLFSRTECQKVLLRRGIIELIVQAMMVNMQSQRTQMLGCSLLCALCDTAHSRVIVVDACGVEATVYAMLTQFSSESVQDKGCRILSCCSLDPLMACYSEELNPKLVDAILTAMDNFPDSVKVHESAVIALRNFASHEANSVILQPHAHRVAKALNKSVAKFPNECAARADDTLKLIIPHKIEDKIS